MGGKDQQLQRSTQLVQHWVEWNDDANVLVDPWPVGLSVHSRFRRPADPRTPYSIVDYREEPKRNVFVRAHYRTYDGTGHSHDVRVDARLIRRKTDVRYWQFEHEANRKPEFSTAVFDHSLDYASSLLFAELVCGEL